MKRDTKRDPKKTAKNKADKLYQQIGSNMYKYCAVCNKPMSCLHHYYPKSTSAGLRYEIKNGVPLCVGCHLRHHSANDPDIQSGMILFMKEQWGDNWDIELRQQKQILQEEKKVKDLAWYKVQIDILQELLNNSEANAYLPPQDLWKT